AVGFEACAAAGLRRSTAHAHACQILNCNRRVLHGGGSDGQRNAPIGVRLAQTDGLLALRHDPEPAGHRVAEYAALLLRREGDTDSVTEGLQADGRTRFECTVGCTGAAVIAGYCGTALGHTMLADASRATFAVRACGPVMRTADAHAVADALTLARAVRPGVVA